MPTSDNDILEYGNNLYYEKGTKPIPKDYGFVENDKVILHQLLKLKYLMHSIYKENRGNVNKLYKKILTEAKSMQIGPNIIQLLEIFMLLPFSTAACKRRFSVRIKRGTGYKLG
eukprot:TRINITY_DN15160_c0_g1_i1.p2 TRINITY_DN15160_c0_g1~~TRINITY_DN15160_c0_g1_i1.p2  ORF type:complete len:114 (-),score=9.26 TRINITY_DN15160_c0_g1_i1:100-441(-)